MHWAAIMVRREQRAAMCFCKKYPNRDAALSAALVELKAQMTKYA
jgi:hypothetical protein